MLVLHINTLVVVAFARPWKASDPSSRGFGRFGLERGGGWARIFLMSVVIHCCGNFGPVRWSGVVQEFQGILFCQCLCCQSVRCPRHRQALQDKDGEWQFEMFAETDILPDDYLAHESNCVSGPQSGGKMHHKIDALFEMQARKVATTFDTRSEETYIDDTPRRHQVRAENARKVAEDNAKVQRRFREE